MMEGQHVLCVAVSVLLLAGFSAPQMSAIEPGACENVTECTSCLALAPNCSWYVCQQDPTLTHCANTTTGAAESCYPVNLTDCAVPVDVSTTPEPSTTVFPTTTEPPTTEPTTTEPPTTEPPTTEAPTTEAPTTEVPTTEVPTTEVPTTEVPTTEVPTTEVPTTEVPTTVAPDPTPTSPPSPAPRTGGFSFGSFVGGMVFCLVIFAGVFIGLKIYRRRQAMAGRYNNL